MRRIPRLISILSLAVLLPGGAIGGTSHFVGNGGELITDGAFFRLRDFYDYGIDVPFAGAGADIELRRRLDHLSSEIFKGIEADLAARKLTDLNRIRAGLGTQIVSLWGHYEWRFTDDDLGSSDDDAPVRALPPGTVRKTVANRMSLTIQVSRSLWNRMEPGDRLGLLVHEAVYSLLPPDPVNGAGFFRQWAWKAREITARMFLAPTSEREASLRALLSGLVLPDENLQCGAALAPGIRARLVRLVPHGQSVLSDELFLENPLDLTARESFVRDTCSLSPFLGSETDPDLRIQMTMNRDPFFLFDSAYRTERSEQIAVRIYPRADRKTVTEALSSQQTCEDSWRRRLKSWFAPESPEDRDEFPSCQMRGSADEAKLIAIYRKHLFRTPDSDGFLYYLSKLNSGASLAEVENEISSSLEAKYVIFYKTYLRRLPSMTEILKNNADLGSGRTNLRDFELSLRLSPLCKADCLPDTDD